MNPWLQYPGPGMSSEEYRRLVAQWANNRLTWTPEDVQRLQARVRRIVKRENDGSTAPR